MLRPNTELLTEDVMQGQPRFVDISKGTLTAETKRSNCLLYTSDAADES